MAGTADIDYEVYRLLHKRITPEEKVEYLVRWKGFTSDWDTWEPAENLQNCGTKIYNFERKAKKVTQNYAKMLVHRSKLTKKTKEDVSQVPNQPLDKKTKRLGRPPQLKQQRGSGRKPSGKNIPDIHKQEIVSLITPVLYTDTCTTNSEIMTKPKLKVKNNPNASSISGSEISKTKSPKSLGRPKKFKKNINGKLVINDKLHKGVQKKRGRKKIGGNSEESKAGKGLKKLSVVNKKLNDSQIKNKNRQHENGDMESIFQSVIGIDASRSEDKDSVINPKKMLLSESETPKLKQFNKKVHVKYGFKMSRRKKDEEQCNAKDNSTILSISQNSKAIKRKRSSKSPNNNAKSRFKVSVSRLIGTPKMQGKQLHLDNSQLGEDTTSKRSLSVKKRKSGITSTGEAVIKAGSSESDDDEVLYSLATDVTDSGQKTESGNKVKSKSESSIKRTKKSPESGMKKVRKTHSTSKDVHHSSRTSQQKIRLLDSIRQAADKPVRPVSPTPLFTNVKMSAATATVLPSAQPPAQQPQWQVGQESPTEGATKEQADLPLSPATMSYKVLLENLPRQLHPKKASKKSSEDIDEDVERRISVRATECAFKYKEILIKKCHKYTQIWLNTHTKMKNSINPLVIQEISAALSAAKYDDSNLVMLSGLGNVFCSGIDLHFLTSGDRRVAARQMSDALRDLIRKFTTFPKLIVAVVTGPAIGLGTAILPLCDIVYASDKASFSLPYGQLAQTPEGCSSYTLPQCCGVAMASELLVGGRKITAIEACQLGLVSQVYWPTSMMQEVIPRVQNMALLSGKALETTKLLIRSHQRTKLDLTNESECNLLVERWPTAECQKAMEEFIRNEKNFLL